MEFNNHNHQPQNNLSGLIFWIIFSFAIGVIFSPFSYGFAFLIGFALVSSLASIAYNRNSTPLIVFGIFSVTILGFLIGRAVIKDDWSPFRMDYSLEKDDKKKDWLKNERKNEYDDEHNFRD